MFILRLGGMECRLTIQKLMRVRCDGMLCQKRKNAYGGKDRLALPGA